MKKSSVSYVLHVLQEKRTNLVIEISKLEKSILPISKFKDNLLNSKRNELSVCRSTINEIESSLEETQCDNENCHKCNC